LTPAIPGCREDEYAFGGPSRDLERLAAMQSRLTLQYFRLLEAHHALRARRKDVIESPGIILDKALERQRKRIADELHSSVGGDLSAINLNLDLLREALPEPPENVRRRTETIGMLSNRALDVVRSISKRLYAAPWQAQPLSAALRDVWEISGVLERFEPSFDVHDPAAEPAPHVREALYFIAKEALSNVIKHSHARHAGLSLRNGNGYLCLEVEDDGCGFDYQRMRSEPPASAGIGLRSMREMAERVGGDLDIVSGRQGTKLTLSIPVKP